MSAGREEGTALSQYTEKKHWLGESREISGGEESVVNVACFFFSPLKALMMQNCEKKQEPVGM